MACQSSPQPPDFISFLFSGKPKFDCYFIVGHESLVKPERIGAVKLMLMAHSPVFRNELEESELRVKKDESIAITDIFPETFRNLLRYVYGYDTIEDMGFHEADNLYYVADKYMIPGLKKKLAERLIPLVTPENICSLLNNPACRNDLLLKSNIREILRYETHKVLASPCFPDVCADGFIAILEQDGLAVPEIELWRAALKWAKHNSKSEDCQVLRQKLSGVSEHIRICTLSGDQFCNEVVPAGILNDREVVSAVKAIGEKTIIREATMFSCSLEPREVLRSVDSRNILSISIPGPENKPHFTETWCFGETFFTILIKESAVELMPFDFLAQPRLRPFKKYHIVFTIRIEKYTEQDNWEILHTLNMKEKVEFGKMFTIPFSAHGCGVLLLPNTKYRIWFLSKDPVGCYKWPEEVGSVVENEHFIVQNSLNYNTSGYICYPIGCIRYRV